MLVNKQYITNITNPVAFNVSLALLLNNYFLSHMNHGENPLGCYSTLLLQILYLILPPSDLSLDCCVALITKTIFCKLSVALLYA